MLKLVDSVDGYEDGREAVKFQIEQHQGQGFLEQDPSNTPDQNRNFWRGVHDYLNEQNIKPGHYIGYNHGICSDRDMVEAA